MEVKVCGIRNRSNLSFLATSEVDYVGFIFFQKSKRYFHDGDLTESDLKNFPKSKVGVFVNEDIDSLIQTVNKYHLNGVQLHGKETADYCQAVKEATGCFVWKVFSVADVLPNNLAEYQNHVDAFLFDTKGKDLGGNGYQFDWSALDGYSIDKPFVLSGGIGADDATEIKKLSFPNLKAIDINSRFEIEPGLKDEGMIAGFLREIVQ